MDWKLGPPSAAGLTELTVATADASTGSAATLTDTSGGINASIPSMGTASTKPSLLAKTLFFDVGFTADSWASLILHWKQTTDPSTGGEVAMCMGFVAAPSGSTPDITTEQSHWLSFKTGYSTYDGDEMSPTLRNDDQGFNWSGIRSGYENVQYSVALKPSLFSGGYMMQDANTVINVTTFGSTLTSTDRIWAFVGFGRSATGGSTETIAGKLWLTAQRSKPSTE